MKLAKMLVGALVVCATAFATPATSLFAQSMETPKDSLVVVAGEINADGLLELEQSVRMIPVVENVPQTYTVMVPYTEQIVKDGKTENVTRMRAETRTRMVAVTRMKRKAAQGINLEAAKFYRVSGEEVDVETATDYFSSKQPVVVIQHGKELHELYRAVLTEETIIVELPDPATTNYEESEDESTRDSPPIPGSDR